MLNADSTKTRETIAEGTFNVPGGVLTPAASNYGLTAQRTGVGEFEVTLNPATGHSGADISTQGDGASVTFTSERISATKIGISVFELTVNGPNPLDPAVLYLRVWDVLAP